MDSNYKLLSLYEQSIGRKLEKINNPEIVMALLKEGNKDIIMDFVGKEDNKCNNRIQIVLEKIEGGQIIFYNPLSHPGNTVDGINSIREEEFITFFTERDAVCYSE